MTGFVTRFMTGLDWGSIRSSPRVKVLLISGVSSKEVTEMGLLQAYFRNSDVLNGFYGLPRSGANYI